MQSATAVAVGFGDAVRESQSVFRLAMQVMAAPGRIVPMNSTLVPPRPLLAPTAALLLSLCDFETAVWLEPTLAEAHGVRDFLRFHTGLRLIACRGDAGFAVIAGSSALLDLSAFSRGTAQFPDRSTTLIVQVEAFCSSGWKLAGPGIRGSREFCATPLRGDFARQLRANRAAFPQGVDIFFATHDAIAAVPRSSCLTERD